MIVVYLKLLWKVVMGNIGDELSFKEESLNLICNIFLVLLIFVWKYYMFELLVFNMSKIYFCFKEKVYSCDI